MKERDIEAENQFHTYRIGFKDGVKCAQHRHELEAYKRGWTDGACALSDALQRERKRLGLPRATLLRENA